MIDVNEDLIYREGRPCQVGLDNHTYHSTDVQVATQSVIPPSSSYSSLRPLSLLHNNTRWLNHAAKMGQVQCLA